MPLKPRFSARLAILCATTIAIGLFGSGRVVSASEQTPAPQLPAAAPAQATQPAGSVLRINAEDAVRMSLENNLGIQAQRLGPEIGTLAVAQARAAYAPNFISTTLSRSSTTPPDSFLSGVSRIITNETFSTNGGFAQNIPWGGGRYQLTLDGSRVATNAFSSFNPSLGSNLSASYTQPLLRGFRIDSLRQQVLTSRNNQVIADLQLREQVTITSQDARNAYFDLVGAIEGHKVARDSLELALQQLKNNQTKLEVGTLAPIDILEAEAEVASYEEAVINAEARIRTSEDRLRALILNPSQADFWTVRLEPSEVPTVRQIPIDVDAAVANALANRTDLARFRKEIQNVDVNLKFAENAALPGLDLVGFYNVVGRAGTELEYGQGFPPPVLSSSDRGFGGALRDVFGQEFRTWSVQLQFSYPIGRSAAEAAAASARLQRQQGMSSLREAELLVATAVRDAARQVNTNVKRVEATSKARERAERRLEAEQKRMTVGLSTTFQLFQAQRDLARQRQQEVNAIIDYNRSVTSFEAIQIAPAR